MPNDIANNMAETIRFLEEENASLMKAQVDLQLAYNEQMIELRKSKRLLKSAKNVLDKFIPCDEDYCSECIRRDKNCDYDDSFHWLYLDEAIELLNKEGVTE